MVPAFEQEFIYNGEKFLRNNESNNVLIPEGTWVLVAAAIFSGKVDITVNTYSPDAWKILGGMRGDQEKTLVKIIAAKQGTRIGVNTSVKMPLESGALLRLTLLPLS